MRKLLIKIKNNILISTLCFILIFILLTILLNTLFKVTFLNWIFILVTIIAIIFLIIGLIQTIKNTKKTSVKIILICIITFVATIIAVLSPIILLLITSFIGRPEHIVEKNNQKYVAEVRSFLDVNVYYYDYINLFIRGNEEKIHEYYGKGGYDPFDKEHSNSIPYYYEYYDEKGNVIKTNQ